MGEDSESAERDERKGKKMRERERESESSKGETAELHKCRKILLTSTARTTLCSDYSNGC